MKKGPIITSQQKDAKNQMLMVTTNDMEYNIPLEWERCTTKIESFKKVSEFEKEVKEFFNSKQVKDDVLILQCRYTSKTKSLLEQVISILQVEHHLFYKVADNHCANKLIVLLIHTNRKSPFPLIFTRKWRLVYVDYLLSTKPISLQKDLKKPVAEVMSGDSKPNLTDCASRAFGKLHFPRSMNCLKEKKKLSKLFSKDESNKCGAILEQRLMSLLSEAMRYRSVEDILLELTPQEESKEMEMSFFERHQNILDTLLILAFVDVLLVVYQNGGFKVLTIIYFSFTKKKKQVNLRKNNQEYQQLFEMALSNSELVPMKTPTITVNQLLLVAIEPELYVVRARTKSLFPFSHCIHKWCQQQFSSNKELPSVEIAHRVTILEQVPIGNGKDSLKQWESICSEKANGIYAMDLIRK
ncbi:hypothetical protein RFI_24571 [Reticulomyxa filosa]|uniref:Uncharacterized protein n=1 Tax=Reticulomyxa filosa TaxID=46433 RepID=X6MIB8_RETFI|nr:hypothetical protein RFI_24571 [Reticulomyxa filosa]|eukprot:ETO12805.1 hypothetical protein RFI_24571 [Reticulomyxa filosa]